MKVTLSIITINKNNINGLKKTVKSVLTQTSINFEYIIIDGASTDNSVDIIKANEPLFGGRLKWISEPDKGIYNAMNKGIKMANGEYIQILNSGDCLASTTVVENMLHSLDKYDHPDILFGNMIKFWPDGRKFKDTCGGRNRLSMIDFYRGTLNHNSAYIKRQLFERFGLYDEDLRICSDWKWFLKVIPLGGICPVYTDIDVTYFDMTGISESGGRSNEIIKYERRKVLQEELPVAILYDYDKYYSDISIMQRLHRYPLCYKLVRFLERCLFKLDKWQNRKCFFKTFNNISK